MLQKRESFLPAGSPVHCRVSILAEVRRSHIPAVNAVLAEGGILSSLEDCRAISDEHSLEHLPQDQTYGYCCWGGG